MRPLVIYHKNCLDGFGAAFCAWLKLGDEAEYVALDYSDRASFMESIIVDKSIVGRDIYILDFSFSKADTEYLLSLSRWLVWLDHHKTAFENWCPLAVEYERNYFNFNSTEYIDLRWNNSGVGLAWEYFFPKDSKPRWVTYIQDRDLWQWIYPDTKPFTLALSQLPQDFEVWNLNVWNKGKLTEAGKVIDSYFSTQLTGAVEATRETCNILGNIGLCCNLPPMFSSEAGNMLAKETGTYGATWFKDSEGNIKWSLRSIGDFDVSAIAKQFGGGGHKNAAGFVLTPASGETEQGVKLWHT